MSISVRMKPGEGIPQKFLKTPYIFVNFKLFSKKKKIKLPTTFSGSLLAHLGGAFFSIKMALANTNENTFIVFDWSFGSTVQTLPR